MSNHGYIFAFDEKENPILSADWIVQLWRFFRTNGRERRLGLPGAGVKTDDIIAKALAYEANASLLWFLSTVCSFMIMIPDRGNQHKRGS